MSSSKPVSSSYSTRMTYLRATALVVSIATLAAATRRFLQWTRSRKVIPTIIFPLNTQYNQLRITELHEYEEYVNQHERITRTLPENTVYYVYIGASNDPDTNQPWCGDCRKANPVVHQVFDRAFSTNPNIFILTILVSREQWKNTESRSPYRTDPQLQATNLPTLFKFVNGQCVEKLVEESNPKVIEAFIAPQQ